MTLEMRELKGDDLFTLLSIIGKLDIKDEFIKMFENNADTAKVIPMDHQKKEPTKTQLAKQEAEATKRGMEAMAGILQKVLLNLSKIKGDINALLADLTGQSIKTIEELGLKEYTALVIGFFKKEELADFFLIYRFIVAINDGEFKLKDILYKRYANPLSLMSSFTLEGLTDFIFNLFKEVNEEELYETWLHKEKELSFKEFKNKYAKKSNGTGYRPLSKEEELLNIKNAMKYIKPRNEGGETIK